MNANELRWTKAFFVWFLMLCTGFLYHYTTLTMLHNFVRIIFISCFVVISIYVFLTADDVHNTETMLLKLHNMEKK